MRVVTRDGRMMALDRLEVSGFVEVAHVDVVVFRDASVGEPIQPVGCCEARSGDILS